MDGAEGATAGGAFEEEEEWEDDERCCDDEGFHHNQHQQALLRSLGSSALHSLQTPPVSHQPRDAMLTNRSRARERANALSPRMLPNEKPTGASESDIIDALLKISKLKRSLTNVRHVSAKRLQTVLAVEQSLARVYEPSTTGVHGSRMTPAADRYNTQPSHATLEAGNLLHTNHSHTGKAPAVPPIGLAFAPPLGYDVIARDMLSHSAFSWSQSPLREASGLHRCHKRAWTANEDERLQDAVQVALRKAHIARLQSTCGSNSEQAAHIDTNRLPTYSSYSVENLNQIDWRIVAEAAAAETPDSIPRSAIDCKCRWEDTLDGKRVRPAKRGSFSSEEMYALRLSVRYHGQHGKWSRIAEEVSKANGDMIRRTSAECVYAWRHRNENPVVDHHKNCCKYQGQHFKQAQGKQFTTSAIHSQMPEMEEENLCGTSSGFKRKRRVFAESQAEVEDDVGVNEQEMCNVNRANGGQAFNASNVNAGGDDSADATAKRSHDDLNVVESDAHAEMGESEVWTRVDDDALQEAIMYYGTDFGKVVKHSRLREKFNREQCAFRWRNVLSKQRKSGWDEQLDMQLRSAVQRFERADGSVPWARVAAEVDGKTDQLCRDRWVNVLDPTIKKGLFDENEDKQLVKGVQECIAEHQSANWMQLNPPVRWTDIAVRYVGGRNGRQLRERWHKLYSKNLLANINECLRRDQVQEYEHLDQTDAASTVATESARKSGYVTRAQPKKRQTKHKNHIVWNSELLQRLHDAVEKYSAASSSKWTRIAQEIGHGISANQAKSKYNYLRRAQWDNVQHIYQDEHQSM